MRITEFCAAGLLLVVTVASAQFGRMPYPGGRGGVGLPSPVPGGGHPRSSPQSQAEEPLANFSGTLHANAGKSFTLDTADASELEFRCTRKTRFYDGDTKVKSASLKPGARLTVEARRAADGTLEAVNVRLNRSKQ